MADLIDILPDFDLKPWRHLTYSLEKKNVSTAELLSQDPVEIARRCPLPLKEVRRMVDAVNAAIRANLVLTATVTSPTKATNVDQEPPTKKRRLGEENNRNGTPLFVKTLDANIDACLGGGFPTGSICEIVGESAVGKTQFVLSLLLTAQLPAPKGLGRSVIYFSTEDALNTSRLHQILHSNPEYQDLPAASRPSLDRIFTLSTRDFDQQENIIQYKLPFLIQQNNVGLLVIDSIAANFRIQFPGAAPAVLARRALALMKLGNTLRRIAHEHNIAIVVTNQVADRFDESRIDPDKFRTPSILPSSSTATATNTTQHLTAPQASAGPTSSPATQASQAQKDEVMSLDYQQCFFTGWGDDPDRKHEAQKNPALGLTWVNQVDARIVLKIVHESKPTTTDNIFSDHKRRRYLSVVFAPWAPPSVMPVEYELQMQGPASIALANGQAYVQSQDFDDEDFDGGDLQAVEEGDEEIKEMLNPKYWDDDPDDDDEFP